MRPAHVFWLALALTLASTLTAIWMDDQRYSLTLLVLAVFAYIGSLLFGSAIQLRAKAAQQRKEASE